jgi:hypothetical protein
MNINHDNSIEPATLESLNQISGAYSAQFWDGFYETCGDADMLGEAIRHLAYYHNREEDYEALRLLRLYHAFLQIDFPKHFEFVMAIPELHAAFANELLLDAQDIAGDYESEERDDA